MVTIAEEIDSATESLDDDEDVSDMILQSIIASTTDALQDKLEEFAENRRRAMAEVRGSVVARVDAHAEHNAKADAVSTAVRKLFADDDKWVTETVPDDIVAAIARDVTKRLEFTVVPRKSTITTEDGETQAVFVVD